MKAAIGGRLFLALVVGVVLASVIGGLLILGSPSEQRSKKLDARRVTELRKIARSVDLYWTRHETLPSNLKVLEKEPGVSITITDPESGRPYTYREIGSDTYELCAVFATESSGRASLWAHGRGQNCFKFKTKCISR